MSQFKDLFSNQAQDYSKFRPFYPDELFHWLSRQAAHHDAAWDCGTGNGQAAVALALHYRRVHGTDPSEKQLAAAEQRPNLRYSVGTAEASGLADHSVDLITVAQAYHWFDHPRFFGEAQRVGKPGAILAVWSYALARISPELDAIVKEWHDGLLGPYWEKERQHVSNGYRDLPFPFERLQAPAFQMQATWSLSHLIGYLGTWSALQTYQKKTGQDPREAIVEPLRQAWGDSPTREAHWDLTLLVGRLPASV